MVGRLVSCNVTLGGRCSGPARVQLATDRDGRGMPARVGRRNLWRATQRLDRALDRPVRGLADSDAFQGEIAWAQRGNVSPTTIGRASTWSRTRTTIIGLLSPP